MGFIEKFFFGKKSEVAGKKSEVAGKKSEVAGKKSEVAGKKSEVAGKNSEVTFERFSGSGVCDVCNNQIGPGDAYLVPTDIFYTSKKYREIMAESPLLFGGSVDDFIAVTKSMDQTSHSAVCQKCIYLFTN